MSRMGQELVNMAESINTMDIATAIIEVLDENGIATNKANFDALWNHYRNTGGLERGLEDSVLFGNHGAINWEG